VISRAKFPRARNKGNRKLFDEGGVADVVGLKSLSKTHHGDSHEKRYIRKRNGERCREDVL